MTRISLDELIKYVREVMDQREDNTATMNYGFLTDRIIIADINCEGDMFEICYDSGDFIAPKGVIEECYKGVDEEKRAEFRIMITNVEGWERSLILTF